MLLVVDCLCLDNDLMPKAGKVLGYSSRVLVVMVLSAAASCPLPPLLGLLL